MSDIAWPVQEAFEEVVPPAAANARNDPPVTVQIKPLKGRKTITVGLAPEALDELGLTYLDRMRAYVTETGKAFYLRLVKDDRGPFQIAAPVRQPKHGRARTYVRVKIDRDSLPELEKQGVDWRGDTDAQGLDVRILKPTERAPVPVAMSRAARLAEAAPAPKTPASAKIAEEGLSHADVIRQLAADGRSDRQIIDHLEKTRNVRANTAMIDRALGRGKA